MGWGWHLPIASLQNIEVIMKKLLGINPLVMVIVSSEYSDGEVMSNFTDYGFKGRLLSRFGWGGGS